MEIPDYKDRLSEISFELTGNHTVNGGMNLNSNKEGHFIEITDKNNNFPSDTSLRYVFSIVIVFFVKNMKKTNLITMILYLISFLRTGSFFAKKTRNKFYSIFSVQIVYKDFI